VISVQVFNSNWATMYNQTFTNSPGTATVSSLAGGTYHVKVNFNSASWSSICEKIIDVIVSTSGSANTFAFTANEQVAASQRSRIILLSSNPIKASIKLGIELERSQKIVVTIMDVEGRTLFTKSSSYTQGRHEAIFTPGSLPAGSYLLKITGETFVEAKKISRQ
jgi:hypothetical protein